MACKGLCYRFKSPGKSSEGRYFSGQKRCQRCEIYLKTTEIRCPCCNSKLRGKPRANKWKSIYNTKSGIIEEVRLLEPIDRQFILDQKIAGMMEEMIPLYHKDYINWMGNN